MAATAEKVMAGGGDNSVFVVINLMLASFDGWGGRGQLSIGCDQFNNVNIIIYKKIQLEDAIIDGGIAVKFQLLSLSSELEKRDKLSSDK
jgi:hypothetical protein